MTREAPEVDHSYQKSSLKLKTAVKVPIWKASPAKYSKISSTIKRAIPVLKVLIPNGIWTNQICVV